jgi:hypothetical protein
LAGGDISPNSSIKRPVSSQHRSRRSTANDEFDRCKEAWADGFKRIVPLVGQFRILYDLTDRAGFTSSAGIRSSIPMPLCIGTAVEQQKILTTIVQGLELPLPIFPADGIVPELPPYTSELGDAMAQYQAAQAALETARERHQRETAEIRAGLRPMSHARANELEHAEDAARRAAGSLRDDIGPLHQEWAIRHATPVLREAARQLVPQRREASASIVLIADSLAALQALCKPAGGTFKRALAIPDLTGPATQIHLHCRRLREVWR